MTREQTTLLRLMKFDFRAVADALEAHCLGNEDDARSLISVAARVRNHMAKGKSKRSGEALAAARGNMSRALASRTSRFLDRRNFGGELSEVRTATGNLYRVIGSDGPWLTVEVTRRDITEVLRYLPNHPERGEFVEGLRRHREN